MHTSNDQTLLNLDLQNIDQANASSVSIDLVANNKIPVEEALSERRFATDSQPICNTFATVVAVLDFDRQWELRKAKSNV